MDFVSLVIIDLDTWISLRVKRFAQISNPRIITVTEG